MFGVTNILKSIKNMDSEKMYKQMLETNPQFRKFAEDIKGKTIEEVAMEYDIDLSILKQFM